MLKTTIPTLEIKSSGIDLTSIQTIFISIKQRDFETTKSNEDIEVDDSVISVSLKKTEYEKFKNGDISISINAYGYDGNSYKIKTEWAKFGSRTSYEGGSGGGTEYEILPTVESVEANTESGKLVDALAIKEVFTSVSNGKSLIASAITDKGIQTDATDTFETMANNIGSIQGGGSGEDCPITSPYLFELNSKIPLCNTGTGSIIFTLPITKLKRFVVKRLYLKGTKASTSNSSGNIGFYVSGRKTGSTSVSDVKNLGSGYLSTSQTSYVIVNIVEDTEVDLTGFEEITSVYLYKAKTSGVVLLVDVTLQFQAELYF